LETIARRPGFSEALHVSGGVVWTRPAAGHAFARRTGLRVGEFLESPRAAQGPFLVMGHRANAPLIAGLAALGQPPLLVTPAAVPAAKDLESPDAALHHACRYPYPPSLGGIRAAAPGDLVAYRLAAALDGGDGDLAARLVQAHPAWPALSFVPLAGRRQAAELLAAVLDPRWYVDPSKPDRSARLEAYLGLTPKIQQAAALGRAIHGADRCLAVQAAWFPDPLFRAAAYKLREFSPEKPIRPRAGAVAPGLRPQDFLVRAWANRAATPGADPVVAVLRASQLFTRFLRDVWLDSVVRTRDVLAEGGLFRPEHWFAHPEEAEAFKAHLADFVDAPTDPG
jgi:hypothetical protein